MEKTGCITQCLFILDRIIPARALRHFFEKQHQVPAVIGMGRDTTGHFSQIIPGYNRMRIGPAYTKRCFGCDTARPHMTNPAAEPLCAEFTRAFLFVRPGETGVHTVVFCLFQ